MITNSSQVNSLISKDEIAKIIEIQSDFLDSYKDQVLEKGLKNSQWLFNQISKHLPEKTKEEVQIITDEIIDSINDNDKNLKSLQESKAKGISKFEWFANKLSKFVNSDTVKNASQNISKENLISYFNRIDNSLLEANTLMFNAIKTKFGSINQNPNLDGIISEHFHANTFNIDATIKNENFKAIVKDSNNLNSVDISILDNGKIVKNYQSKYGKDYNKTIDYFKQGDYRGQNKLVPSDQVENIKNAKSQLEYNNVRSKQLTKEEAKNLQKDVQQENFETIKYDYNSLDIKTLALEISKKAAFSALLTSATTFGYRIIYDYSTGKEIKVQEIVKEAIENGSDTFVKESCAGALKVASEKGYIKLLPKGTSSRYITNIAYFGVETLKTFYKVSKGEISFTDALDSLGGVACAIAFSDICSNIGAGVGTAIGGILGTPLGLTGAGMLVGGAIGSVIGGFVGFTIGEKTGKKIVDTVKKVGSYAYETAKSIVQSGVNVVKSVANTIYETASSFASSISSVGSSIISGIGSLFGF